MQRETHSPEINRGANRLKLNPAFTSCIHKQVCHGFSVVVGARAGHAVRHCKTMKSP